MASDTGLDDVVEDGADVAVGVLDAPGALRLHRAHGLPERRQHVAPEVRRRHHGTRLVGVVVGEHDDLRAAATACRKSSIV